jgi:hypothetical protein
MFEICPEKFWKKNLLNFCTVSVAPVVFAKQASPLPTYSRESEIQCEKSCAMKDAKMQINKTTGTKLIHLIYD